MYDVATLFLKYVCVSNITEGNTWVTWETWDSCTVTCGNGSQSRTRACIEQYSLPTNHSCYQLKTEAEQRQCHTLHIMLPCDGGRNESRICNTNTCPGNMHVCAYIVRLL